MTRYKKVSWGILDTKTNVSFEINANNKHALAYRKWVKKGNTPDPEFTDKDLTVISNDRYEKYLQSTDWYVIRFLERGIPVPKDISKKRQEASDKII